MKVETRTKNSSRNIVFSLLSYAIRIILEFLIRRVFLQIFSVEYLGLNSLFTNILSILSLADLGIGAALIFAMYKPVAEKDDEKVRQLLAFYKKSYIIIGCVITGLGLLVLPFMNLFQAKAPNVDVNIYVIYIIFLFNTVISYFFAYRQALLYTNQRNDIETKIKIVTNIIMSAVTLAVLYLTKNYYLYAGIAILTTLSNNLSVYLITSKLFPELVKKPQNKLDEQSKKDINKNIFALFFHKLGSVIVYGTDSLIIYIMLNSATLGKYSNYLLITTSITSIITMISLSIRGSVGNSIATQNQEANAKLLNKLSFVYFWMISFCTICIFVLSDPFIDTVLASGGNKYSFDLTIILLLSIQFYLNISRQLVTVFKECVGLFYQDRFKPIIESIVNLVVSILLTLWIGLPGVIIGTIVSTIVAPLWVEPYVLNKYYLKQSTWKYFGKYAIYSIAMLISGVATYFVCYLIPNVNILTLVAKFAICAVVPNVCLLICLCWMPEFKECVAWAKDLLHRKMNKHNNIAIPNTDDQSKTNSAI